MMRKFFDSFALMLLVGLTACGVQEHPLGGRTILPPVTGYDAGQAVPPVSDGGDSEIIVPPPLPDASTGQQEGQDATPAPEAGPGADDAAAKVEAGPKPSGNSVMIGGVLVPQEKAIAFIHFGHSNMAGRGQAPASLRPYFFTDIDPQAWMFHVGKQFEPAREPFTAGDSTSLSSQSGGPGTPLIKMAAAMAPGYTFISLGYGKNAAYCSQFLPNALYYDQVMAAPRLLKGKVTFGAIVVMLGITERHGTQADITGYPTCILKLVTAIRNELGVPDLPLLITDYEMTATGGLAPTAGFAMQIIPQIHMIPTVVPNSAIVPTDGLHLIDDHHFQLDAHQIWVGRALQIMKDKGWFPW
jgi:hypothetical protein